MNVNDSIHFYNQVTKLSGKKTPLTSTDLSDMTAEAKFIDKESRKWTIKMEIDEILVESDPLQFMLDCPKSGEPCVCKNECMYKRR